MKTRTIAESRTEQTQLIMPENLNGNGRLFGGQLMEWIDIVGGVTARRHSNANVTTVVVDSLEFKSPAFVGDLIVLIGQITYVGTTSMEVKVETYIEHLDGNQELMNRAYLVYVALGEDEQPIAVPKIVIETSEQKTEYQAAEKRRLLRDQRKSEEY